MKAMSTKFLYIFWSISKISVTVSFQIHSLNVCKRICKKIYQYTIKIIQHPSNYLHFANERNSNQIKVLI